MDTMAWFRTYLEEQRPNDRLLPRQEWAVRLCEKLYRRTGDAAFRAYIIGCADAVIAAENWHTAAWRMLFFALNETGGERYREAIGNVLHMAGRDPVYHTARTPLEDELPFRMAYEMQLNGMEKVGLVAGVYRQACSEMWDADGGLHGYLPVAVRMLLALTDAISLCSDQLYEHWRALVDLYRAGLKAALSVEAKEPETAAMLVYALHEGVRLGLIDPERYLPMADRRIEALRAAGEETAAEMLKLEGSDLHV